MRIWIQSRMTASLLLLGWLMTCAALFSSGTPRINTIPFTEAMGDDNIPHLLVQATVNGKSVILLFDTGADMTTVGPKIVKGCRVVGEGRQFSSTGSNDIINVVTDITIGTDTLHNAMVMVTTTALSDALHTHVDGLLGENVLSRYKRVIIDYDAKTIRLEN